MRLDAGMTESFKRPQCGILSRDGPGATRVRLVRDYTGTLRSVMGVLSSRRLSGSFSQPTETSPNFEKNR